MAVRRMIDEMGHAMSGMKREVPRDCFGAVIPLLSCNATRWFMIRWFMYCEDEKVRQWCCMVRRKKSAKRVIGT